MKKRELNISDKKLFLHTQEDIIFKAPLRIPHKDLQELQNLKDVNLNHYAFYDIANTEKQVINYKNTLRFQIFGRSFGNESEFIPPHTLQEKMGDINIT
tara:strand:- start:2030 stop:2326 length:297 start_codon:yes stop_codon:yes gene_type:complete